MAIPDFQTLMLPLLRLAGDGAVHSMADAINLLAVECPLSDEDRAELLPSGKQPRFNNRVGWSATYLRKAGLLVSLGPGRIQITDRGRAVLGEKLARVDLKFLSSRFPEIDTFRGRADKVGQADAPLAVFDEDQGAWLLRPELERRMGDEVRRRLRDDAVRRDVLEFLAFAIENADAERSDAWCLRVSSSGIKLIAGGLQACMVTRTRLEVSVLGPISDAVRAQVGAEVAEDETFSLIQGALILQIPLDRARNALNALQDAFDSFVDLAMARLRRPPSLEHHVPELVSWLSRELGRELPQPEPLAEVDEPDDGETDDEEAASREPRSRGRSQIFERGERSISSLLGDIERGVIALPDLQRPFVWEDTKIRNLFDSLFLGFPVGTLVLWHTADTGDARAIGSERQALRPATLVIDGQQRLTSVVTVMQGREVTDKDGATRRVTLAFRPRDGRFEVADATTRNNPEFLADVSELWTSKQPNMVIRRRLLERMRDQGRAVEATYEQAVEANIDFARRIHDYRFPTIEIRDTGNGTIDDADISEIFVRINNEGKRLGQADFVLTLLSVYQPDLRERIEARARAMSDGSLVALDAQQILRAACGVAFGRARMSAVYRYIRGFDPTQGNEAGGRREQVLQRLDAAARECLEPGNWRDFLLRVQRAGFVASSLIGSRNAIVNAYAFYILGQRAQVERRKLDELISRWVFATLLTARYSGQSETIFEQDLVRVASVQGGEFLEAMDSAMSLPITGDYWTVALVAALETQKARAPAPLAFRAAQVVLGARALFSDQTLRDVLAAPARAGRAGAEMHHLFPRAWLEKSGIRDPRRINQVANLADLGPLDVPLGNAAPATSIPRLREKLGIDDQRWGQMCAEHALPPGWEAMPYDEFLVQRRRRMADLIRVAFRQLGGEEEAPPLTPPWFLPGSEVIWQRISETERALRKVVREVYSTAFATAAAAKIAEVLPERDRRDVNHRTPAGADPLACVDYLYLRHLPMLLFSATAWPTARAQLGGSDGVRDMLKGALERINRVRNDIAHSREVAPDELQRTSVACSDVLAAIGAPRSS
jgi:hypothetical protein